jgi:hypothetical protein
MRTRRERSSTERWVEPLSPKSRGLLARSLTNLEMLTSSVSRHEDLDELGVMC